MNDTYDAIVPISNTRARAAENAEHSLKCVNVSPAVRRMPRCWFAAPNSAYNCAVIDWAAIKAEFILHPEVNCAQLAEKYRLHHVSVRRKAAHERWVDQRRNQATQLLQTATQKAVLNQSEELAQCNQRDLRLAEKLKTAVEQRLESSSALTENGLRNLAVVTEAAQRVARLALGVATENIGNVHDPYTKMSDAELAAELERLGIEPRVQ